MENVSKLKFENTSRLETLYKYLNYEISSSILFAFGWFYFALIFVVTLAAIVFTPFMLYVLCKEGKKGWIIFFIILVIAPLIPITIFYSSFAVVTLAPFYLYCFLLRVEAKSWLIEMRARNELVLQKINKANAGTALEDWMVMR